MNLLVLLAHPDPASLNHAIALAVSNALRATGHHVVFHDLYAEGFDPLLTSEEIPETGRVPANILKHCDELRNADGIVIVHPNWWGQPPAILKGWIDRVLRPGVAYRFDEGDSGEGVAVGLLKAEAALVLNTSNTPDAREQATFGDPLESLWKRCIFELCGVTNVQRRTFAVVVTSTLQQRKHWIDEAKDLATTLFPTAAHTASVLVGPCSSA